MITMIPNHHHVSDRARPHTATTTVTATSWHTPSYDECTARAVGQLTPVAFVGSDANPADFMGDTSIKRPARYLRARST